MTSPPTNGYLLTPAAQTDLNDIWDYTARTWSSEQASLYVRNLEQTLQMIVSQLWDRGLLEL